MQRHPDDLMARSLLVLMNEGDADWGLLRVRKLNRYWREMMLMWYPYA